MSSRPGNLPPEASPHCSAITDNESGLAPGRLENERLVAYLLPTGHVAPYSVPLFGGAFIWGGKVHRQQRAGVPSAARVGVPAGFCR